MKTILVATDFSDHANIAVVNANTLARRLGAKLVYVHAAFMDEARPNAYEMARGQVEGFRRMLQEQMVHLRENLADLAEQSRADGIAAEHELLDGSPAASICKAAGERQADLVVIGSHGRTGFKRILLGSVAEQVVRKCPTSVLVAREPGVGPSGYHRILVPTDFSESARHAYDSALRVAADDATIDLLHCWHFENIVDGSIDPVPISPLYAETTRALIADSEKRAQRWMAVEQAAGRTVAFHHHEGRPASSIQAFIHEREPDYDLVAVGTHGRKGLERILLGSVAAATVRYSPCSVLVARH